ncbi:siderophore-iron reductase FhuF [Microvirga subterranea]|uniref:Ferric iron reductase protein FhuF n=1 Tax=Microvirga subterranea TaxID=186651 RepID=A0A370HJR9_9HYPH|nr:siderophore-iron reductase FhuF [Microvirga subterranea]RDI58836.1 ferric iron reductase protein FhuF [Microvirga subterranea]
MISSLAPCFTGTLLRFKDALALPGEHASSIAGSDLLDVGVAEDLMARFASLHPGGDRRALVSMWTHWHFGALIIPTTAAILLLGRNLPVGLEHVRIALQEDGRTEAVIVEDDGSSRETDGTGRFANLFAGHVEPLIDRFAAQFRVSPRLLWTNAATIFDWALQQASAFDGVCRYALDEGYSMLESKSDATGRPNPMSGAMIWREQDCQKVRKRKVCCLRYLLPGMADCGSLCPLPERSRGTVATH